MSNTAPNAPSWRPDPSGKHAYRYFDGEAWTEHVSDGRTQGIDPLPGPTRRLDALDLALMPFSSPAANRRRLFQGIVASPHSGRAIEHVGFALLVLVGALFVGIGLLIASWHVRSRAAAQQREAIVSGLEIQTISADAPDTVPAGCLVHVKGVAHAQDPVRDDHTGVSMRALVLERTVSMYQWVETCTEHDSRPIAVGPDEHVERRDWRPRRSTAARRSNWTKCRYTKAWTDEPQSIDPDRADRYANPAFPYEHESAPARFVAKRWTLGKLELSSADLPELLGEDLPPIPLTPEHLATLDPELRGRARVEGNALYLGDPKAPEIGDLRFAYAGVTRLTLTLIGERTWRGMKPYVLPDGTELFEVREGKFSVDQLAGARRQDARDLWWAHAWFGSVVALGVALLFWPIRGWGRALPGPPLLTGAGALVFVPLVTTALYAGMFARVWWLSDRDAAVLAAVVAGGASALLLTASTARLMLRRPETTAE
ncbi:MAG TPA: TMEM43 family protein [Vicinamibacteria bacterium]|nr:TMEM43 family protein [Vicinamibacteria bacterium]